MARWRSFQSIIHLPHTIFTFGAATISRITHTLRNHERANTAPTEAQMVSYGWGMHLLFQDAGILGKSFGQSSASGASFDFILSAFVLSPELLSHSESYPSSDSVPSAVYVLSFDFSSYAALTRICINISMAASLPLPPSRKAYVDAVWIIFGNRRSCCAFSIFFF